MAIKLVDELKAMGNFPIAHAEGINLVKTDGTEDNLQNLFNNGELGGGDDSTVLTQQEYEALTEEQKLDGLYYTYDTKRIYKNGIQYGASEPIPLTMEEYKALKAAGAIDEQQEYLIEADEQGILLSAEDTGYNNAESGIQATTVQGAIDKVNANLDELKNITRLTDFDEAIPEKGKNKIYYVNKSIGTYKCAQWRVESMYYDVSGLKQYRGVQKATSINGVDNIMLMREYYLDDNVMHWGAWTELATMDKVVKYPDWSNQQVISLTEITVDQDVYIELNQLSSYPIEDLKINGKVVSVSDSENGLYSTRFSGYVKKGSFISYPYLTNPNIVRVFPLV